MLPLSPVFFTKVYPHVSTTLKIQGQWACVTSSSVIIQDFPFSTSHLLFKIKWAEIAEQEFLYSLVMHSNVFLFSL